jgi:outer membrane protein insertion porin family
VDGLLTARPEGTFQLGRNQYYIESGRIVLGGYPSQPLELDFRARTTVSGVDILLHLHGRADSLTTELSSPDKPNLTRADLASLLVTGRTVENVPELESVSGREREIIGEQLVSYLSGTLMGLVQQGLGEVFPFERITVDPARIAGEVAPEARFTLGMAFTEELSLTYSIGLNNSQSQLWVVDYLLPKKLAVRASQNENVFTGSVGQRFSFDFHRSAEQIERAESRQEITSVEVTGGPPGLEEEMRRQIRARAGERFDYWKAQDDANRLGRIIRREGYLSAVVAVDTEPAGAEAITLRYRVDAGVPISLRWQGDDPGAKIRRDVEDAWDGRLPESFLLSDLTSTVLRQLQRDRYYWARVMTSVEDASDGSREVTFQVTRGPRGERIRIDFDGNQALSDQELRDALPPPTSTELFELLFEKTARLRQTLVMLYTSHGYLDARIGQPQKPTKPEEGLEREFRVDIAVEEGSLSQVAAVDLQGAESIPVSLLREELRLRTGEPFQLQDYVRDRTTLTSLYRQEGFAGVRVGGSLERSEEGVAVAFQVDEGARARVGDIHVVGNQATRDAVILRELTFEKGDPLRLSDLTESQRRLYDLGIFRSADVRVEPGPPDSLDRDVVVDVSETADLDFNYALRYNSDDRFTILTQLGSPNLFGTALHAGLTVEANADKSLVRATFHTPYLSRYALDTDVFISRETEEDEFFSDRAWSLTFQQTRAVSKWLALQWGYTFRHFKTVGRIVTGPFPFEFSVDKSVFTTSVIEDRRDNAIRPGRGRFWNITLQLAPDILGADRKFVKLFGQIFAFVPLGRDVVWASSYRLGVVEPIGEGLLGEDRFKAGGVDSVRGFAQDSLGPVDPITDTALGGQGVAVFNQEIRFPIYRWFRGGVFFDAGNIYPTVEDFNPFDLRYSVGVGFRFNFPFGLLRLDWARVLDRQEGEEASQLWFSFGHAF